MVHRDSHGQRRFEVAGLGDLMDVRRQCDAAEKDQIVYAIQDIKRGPVLDEGVSGKHYSQPDVAGAENPALSEAVNCPPHRRSGQGNEHLIDENKHHRRLDRHAVHLNEREDGEGNKHLLAAALEELQRIEDPVFLAQDKPLLLEEGWDTQEL